jgi:hypothetical protein
MIVLLKYHLFGGDVQLRSMAIMFRASPEMNSPLRQAG